jgi:hypothetical protein
LPLRLARTRVGLRRRRMGQSERADERECRAGGEML